MLGLGLRFNKTKIMAKVRTKARAKIASAGYRSMQESTH